jgi:hypothetical protein
LVAAARAVVVRRAAMPAVPAAMPEAVAVMPAVQGPGGGLDDAVPASIEGREPAKLSDGEFVVPADAVSGLGDGSTQHGIRQLDGMVDRVRQQRTGRTVQPGRVSGAMPA